MLHVYTSFAALFFAEMRILVWGSFILWALALGYGIWLFSRFRRRQRTVVGAGIHLGVAFALWVTYFLLYYYWGSGRQYWVTRVPLWHYDLFVTAGAALLVASVMGLVLHHMPPRPKVTPRLAWTHLSVVALAVVCWSVGVGPFL